MLKLLTVICTLVCMLSISAIGGVGPDNGGPEDQILGPLGANELTDESGQIVPGRYIVVLKQGKNRGLNMVASSEIQSVAASVGAQPTYVYDAALAGFAGELTDAQVEQLKNNPAVDFVEQDRTVSLCAQTVPWGIDRVQGPQAQANGNTGAGVKVGVIDTGIDYLHPDLAALYMGGHDFYFNDTDPMDDMGHGTHVAGTIAGINNTIGVLGVAPAVELYAIKVFPPVGGAPWSIIIAGVNWAAANGMDVVNMSLGGSAGSAAMQLACDNAYAGGMVLVASAGNSSGWVRYPARYASTIAVSAIDVNNNLAWFSCFGPEIDVCSPGVNVYSCYLTAAGSYRYWQGTSMAAPHTTGVVALIIGSGNYTNPIDVRNQLTSTCTDIGTPGYDIYYGHGIPNADAATGLIPRPPIAGFSATPVTGCTPLVVSFADHTSGIPTSWLWDFGDGGTSTLQHPSHTYATNGNYDVTLTATNALGSDQLTKLNLVVVGGPLCETPVVEFAALATTGCAPLTTTFYDVSSGAPTSWLWDFGDGTTSIAQHPVHTYAAGGTYSVSLTATNAYGTGFLAKADYMTVEYLPGVDFTADQTTGTGSLTVNFTDLTAYNPTGWFWDFGDFGTSNLQNPTVFFDQPGDYKVILAATNACGSGELIREAYIRVTEGGEGGCNTPVTAFSGTPLTGTTPLTVAFTDESTNTPFTWNWDFGDLAGSNVQNPTHTYTAAGTYTVVLTTGNDCGENTLTEVGYITVTDQGCVSPPMASFSGTPSTGNAPLSVNFTDQSTNAPTAWAWDFGDAGTSALQNPNHVYATAGVYTVSLTATNACGSNQVIMTNYITVTDPGCTVAPVAGFVGTPTAGGAPLTVNFTDQSTNIPTGWNWDFGDGGTSAAQNPSHVYTVEGSYTVTLTASNSCGSNQIVMTNYITVSGGCTGPPVAIFTGTPTMGTAPLTVNFTDLSTGNPDSWAWEFGDDGMSTQQNPTHTYTKPGDFKVILVVSNACGSDEVVREKFIIVPEGGGGGAGEMGIDGPMPIAFELDQNYPNPFNPTTEISFTLPATAHVLLEVYNIAGQTVATLVDGSMGAGKQTVTWDASGNPSGIYFYYLVAGEYAGSRKMILLK